LCWIGLPALAVALWATAPQARADALYSISDLGSEVIPTGITPGGQIYTSAAGKPYLYVNGQTVPVPTPGLNGGVLAGYNDHGQAAINTHLSDPGQTIHAYLGSGGSISDLGNIGSTTTIAAAINSSGTVVGAAQNGAANYHAFVSSGGRMVDLGTLGGQASGASAINSLGQVVGSSALADGSAHAFLFDGHKLLDLGTLGGLHSAATAINAAGHVVGSSMTASGATHGFLYDTAMHDLGGLGSSSFAYAINGAGQIVGLAYVPNSSGLLAHAVISSGGPWIDLNALIPPGTGWSLLESATGISDDGRIVGYGLVGDKLHGFLLTPRLQAQTAPEPATLAVLALGMAAFAARVALRRRRAERGVGRRVSGRTS
jgi:probable HAF family extracellular repeat protein